MSKVCIECGSIKKSNKGILCRLCSNIKSGKSQERSKKISLAKTGIKHSELTKNKIRVKALIRFENKENHPNFGVKMSDETKRKISLSNSGENNAHWKGGIINSSNGYVYVYMPGSPMRIGNYVLEHRLVMSIKIGRPLFKSEIVHHINGVKDDNRIENLVITNTSDHCSLHNAERSWKEESKSKLRKKAKESKRDNLGRFFSK